MTVAMVLVRTTEPREDAGAHLGEILDAIVKNTDGAALEIIAWDQHKKPTRRQRAALRTLLGDDNFVARELRDPRSSRGGTGRRWDAV